MPSGYGSKLNLDMHRRFWSFHLPGQHMVGAPQFRPTPILWMDEILHALTMKSHCLLVFTGESYHSRVSERWCEMSLAVYAALTTADK